MGSCHSRAANGGGGIHQHVIGSTGFDAVLHKPLVSSQHSRASTTTHNSLILRLPSPSTDKEGGGVVGDSSKISPSEKTNVTAPETPSCDGDDYHFASPNDSRFSFVSPSSAAVLQTNDDDDEPPCYDSASTVTFENRSMNRSVMESVIAEEESLVGPSDEEEEDGDDDILSVPLPSLDVIFPPPSHLQGKVAQKQKSNHDNNTTMTTVKAAAASKGGRHPLPRPPPTSGRKAGVASASPARRSASNNSSKAKQKRAEEAGRLRLMNSRITTPESIVFRPAPLIAPPKGAQRDIPATVVGPKKPQTSVNPQTIANFNRLKIQVELAEQNEMHLRRKSKLEDRLEDVKGYRNLWKDFESLKQQIEGTSASNHQEEPADQQQSTKPTDRSLDLKQSTSWYFDFQSLHSGRHLDGDEEDLESRSQSNLTLLSEVTMETQRKYFEEKRRERRKNKGSAKKSLKKSSSRSFVSDDKSCVSARSSTSRGSAAFVRGTTNISGGDYGPAKEGDIDTMDNMTEYDIGSDDSTPRTRTGREMNRSGTYDEAVSVISELDLDVDNDYNVPRRHRSRRHVADDSSLDTFDDRSIDAGFSNVEFDMTNFIRLVREDKEAEQDKLVRTTTSIPKPTEPPSRTRLPSHTGSRSTPASRVEQYGFDPSAPLSSQLHLFTETVPDNKTLKTARRLDGFFVDSPSSNKKVDKGSPERPKSFPPRKFSNMQQSKTIGNVPEDILIATTTPEPVKKPQNTRPYSYSPYDIMSPSQFQMMTSFHAPSGSSDGEEEEELDREQNETSSNNHHQEDDVKDHDYVIQDEHEVSAESQTNLCKKSSPALKTHDPTIYSLSTEAFLRMSSWHAMTQSLECEPTLADFREDHESGKMERETTNFDQSEDISNQVSDAVEALLGRFQSIR